MSALQETQKKLQGGQQGQREGKEVVTKVQEGATSPKTYEGESQEMQEPSPQPNLSSYYRFIKGGRVIPHKISIPLFFELEKERGRTHH